MKDGREHTRWRRFARKPDGDVRLRAESPPHSLLAEVLGGLGWEACVFSEIW